MDYSCIEVLSIDDKRYNRDHYRVKGKNSMVQGEEVNLLAKFKEYK